MKKRGKKKKDRKENEIQIESNIFHLFFFRLLYCCRYSWINFPLLCFPFHSFLRLSLLSLYWIFFFSSLFFSIFCVFPFYIFCSFAFPRFQLLIISFFTQFSFSLFLLFCFMCFSFSTFSIIHHFIFTQFSFSDFFCSSCANFLHLSDFSSFPLHVQ